MGLLPASNPSKTGEGVIEDSSRATYLGGTFDSKGAFRASGTIQNLEEEKTFWMQKLKERTGGSDVVTSVSISSSVYELVKYYYNSLHWTDIFALFSLTSKPVSSPSKGFMAGERFVPQEYVYQFVRAVNGFSSTDWNSFGASQWEDIKSDPYSPWNPSNPYFAPVSDIFQYDQVNGYLIHEGGKIVNVKTGQVYLVKEQGSVVAYDAKNLTVTFSTGAVFDLKNVFLTTSSNNVIQIEEENPKPWYFKIFGSLLTDSKTQMIVAGILVLLLILKKRFYEQS